VTSGVEGSLPGTSAVYLGPISYRNWSGIDGKYEVVNSRKRLKWNNYSVTGITAFGIERYFRLYWWWKGNPAQTPNPATGVDQILGTMSYGNPSFSQVPVSGTIQNRVLSKLLAEIKGHELNLSVELGQLNQTVDLLSGNLRKLGRSALALRRGDFATAARQLGANPRTTRLKASDISGRWLELQYGWLPLISSSFEAAKAFEAISNGPRTMMVEVAASEKQRYDMSASPTNHSAYVNLKVGRKILFGYEEELSAERQLGLSDPLSVAWELTPWSFVVDWFVPIGTYLSNLHQIPHLKGRWLITDFLKIGKQIVDFQWKDMNYWGPDWGINPLSNPQATYSSCRSVRTYSSRPPPLPLPNFDLRGLNSTRRFWNAVSLAHQRFVG